MLFGVRAQLLQFLLGRGEPGGGFGQRGLAVCGFLPDHLRRGQTGGQFFARGLRLGQLRRELVAFAGEGFRGGGVRDGDRRDRGRGFRCGAPAAGADQHLVEVGQHRAEGLDNAVGGEGEASGFLDVLRTGGTQQCLVQMRGQRG